MAPRKTTPKNPGTSHPTPDTSLSAPTLRHELPGLTRSTGPAADLPGGQLTNLPPASDRPSVIQIRDLVTSDGAIAGDSSLVSHSAESIRLYEVPPQARSVLPPIGAEGLRVHRGRIYAEVQYTTTTTVMVAWDERIETYRVRLPQEVHPSGPALRFDTDSNTWRIAEQQNTRNPTQPLIDRQITHTDDSAVQTRLPAPVNQSSSQPAPMTAYVDTRHYVWNEAVSNYHGYTVMHRKRGLGSDAGPELHYAFKDDNGAFVVVEPSTSRIDQPADLLPGWTDHHLWDLYGLHGADIILFRTEADRIGKRPLWARIREQRQQKRYLDEELRRWQNWGLERERSNHPQDLQNTTGSEPARDHAITPQSDTPTSLTHSPPPHTTDVSTVTDDIPPYGHQSYYTWDHAQTNYHGYVEMQRKPGLNDTHGPRIQVAFHDGVALTIVSPVRYSANNRVLRPYWRDIDIWNLYRIEGEDIVRFRREVAINGVQPSWVKLREYTSLREQWIDYLRLWTNPDSPLKSQEQVMARFQPYNLSIEQLGRLVKEISPSGQFNKMIGDEMPTWVKSHQARTLVVTRFEQFGPYLTEIRDEMIRLRNQGGGKSLLQATLTPPFFRQLLRRSGFKPNKHNYLYRDDIPAVFKVDERTPFDLARAGALLPQPLSAEGSTSAIAVSAMFSLKTAMGFAHPANTVLPSSSTQTKDPLTHSRRIMFCYLIDTRDVEVVPGPDNRIYNATRVNPKPVDDKTLFPSMKMEGHVSMQPTGFTSRRIWLVNSTMTRAATVDDLYTQARGRVTDTNQTHDVAIESRTQAGVLNRDEYEALIDDVATAGKRVMELPPGKDIFSTDITFPIETITLPETPSA
ncbi:hypothetical protein [Pseudomonas sp. 91RF]|uniref:hypothetical protein n=1 Tax=Pseudomonas sp. 91RF TaxID=2292261 RepID=UPI0011C401D6|nr:hypothetical protein [Pseudomonas sp. 91RF]